MSDHDTTDPAHKTTGDRLRRLAFAFVPGQRWDVECDVAAMPPAWLDLFGKRWNAQGHVRSGYHLPTRGLVELLCGIDPAVMHVDSDLDSPTFLAAFPGVDRYALTDAIASWAAAEITADVDWYTELDPAELVFTPRPVNLLDFQVRANHTAAPAPHVYQMLPTFLAKLVVEHRLALLDKAPRQMILGPPQRTGRRHAVLWPPLQIDDDRAGPGLVTAKIEFHVETVPNCPVPQVHADVSISRFPLMPVSYVPARGDGPATATVWLHAPAGFLGRDDEPNTLLSARAHHVWVRGAGRHWQWGAGLARSLARLTRLSFPDPAKIFADPAAAAEPVDPRAIGARILYSEGTKSVAADLDAIVESAGDEARARSKALTHAANTGLVPGDHVDVHTRLRALLDGRGIAPLPDLARTGSKAARRIKARFEADAGHTIELWTQSPVTQEAVLATLEHHFGLTPATDPNDASMIRFTGDLTLTVLLRDGTQVGAGVPQDPDKKRSDNVMLQLHTSRLVTALGKTAERRAAIVELPDAAFFQRAKLIDPKPGLKKAFARTNRRLQCLQPAKVFTPPATWPENAKRKKPEPFPGTRFGVGTILRVAAAVNDCLRQLGRFGPYELPARLPDLEQIGVWLHHQGRTCIPIVIRQQPDGTATAHLAGADGQASHPVPYADLPVLLADGKGRIGPGKRQKQILAAFLINALGVDPSNPATHDRVVLVRASGFRNWGWDWMQDKHLRSDELVLPGIDIEDDEQLPEIIAPEKLPGLRIIRIRDRGSKIEVPRGFSHDLQQHHPRLSGLFQASDRVFYSVNPKSDQMQTPHGRTKLDPDILANFTVQASNPVPVELCVAFQQPGDDTASLATLASLLRRAHAHTDQSTTFPSVLHLCSLADEYL